MQVKAELCYIHAQVQVTRQPIDSRKMLRVWL